MSPSGARRLLVIGLALVAVTAARGGEEIRQFKGYGAQIRSVAFSPDGATVAAGGCNSNIRLWDVATGKPLHTLDGHTD